ncbi:hypothetical protein [Micromonospora ureilytica]|uniref:hypothetical protein n=1 Tax=Micromonospora ureilytica TaxID=709868 RepID=UPI004039221F
MFARFGRAIVLNPWKVIAVWLVLLVGSFFAPSLADQVSTDQASFLPSRYESVQAQEEVVRHGHEGGSREVIGHPNLRRANVSRPSGGRGSESPQTPPKISFHLLARDCLPVAWTLQTLCR